MVKSPALDKRYPGLILKAGTMHHGALGVARTLGRLGVPAYAAVEDASAPLARSRYVTKAFVWDHCSADQETFLKAIFSTAETIGRPAVLFAVDDLSAMFVAENAEILADRFLFPRLPRNLPRQLINKASLYSLCVALGIPCARSLCPKSEADVRDFSKDVTFPIVVKTTEQWRLPTPVVGVTFIPNRQSLFRFLEHIEHEQLSRIILQEYVPGDDWIYHGYSAPESSFCLSFTGQKLLSYPPTGGPTAVGISLNNDTVRAQAELLLKSISYSGIIDMDWRLDRRDGQYKLFDCNPRLGMNFRMFESQAGLDVVRAQHLDLTNRAVDNSPMIDRRLFVVESYWLLSSLRGAHAAATTDEHLPPTAASRELAWWSNDDPLPVFVMSVQLLAGIIKRKLRMIWKNAAIRVAAWQNALKPLW
jgi:D-aspartate ligase